MSQLPHGAQIVIVGAGIMGCSIAYHLSERGASDVLVLEREAIARGATSAAAGGIRLQFSTRTNIELSLISMEYWEHFEERFGIPINFHQQGYLFVLTDEEDVPVFKQNLELQQSMGVPARWVSTEEIGELNPALNLDDVLGGTFCPRDGWADPSSATMGFAQAARRHGVRIVQDKPVTGIEVEGDRVVAVEAEGERVGADLVICCAGPQTGQVAALAGIEIPILPYRRMSWVTGPFNAIPRTVPFTIDFSKSLYFHPEGAGFLFGMTNPNEPSSMDLSVDDDWLMRTIEELSYRAPAFADAGVGRGWAGLYEITPDDNPVLGKVAELENFIVAAGFSGHGFMQGPAIGKVMAELIIDGAARSVDISAFRPSRFQEGALLQEHNVI